MRIAITGTPGVGKTSVAREISEALGLTLIDISAVAEKSGAVVGKEEDSLVVDVETVKKSLESVDNIVIDSHFAEMFDVDFVFVLRCEPSTLCERLKARGYSQEKIRENVLAEILDYSLQNALTFHQPEKIFEILENPVREIVSVINNPDTKRSAACGSKTQFLTEENLALVREC
ncbi:MAG: adenylate kinase family protein [Theionarchaea archaeon]|nr:adenylate kinase family protein [Theionarchaea archaeon]MBU7038262.1 adenylate kinase family protein [Theionarchaea archaeon]